MNKTKILSLLKECKESELEFLQKEADKIREKYVGNEVHLRAIIEISNFCSNDCSYCGINRENKSLKRYRMTEEEILDTVRKCYRLGFKTIVLQSGQDPLLETKFISKILKKIKDEFDIAITLSLGERSTEDYIEFKKSGADRYLLKFETSDFSLYKMAHPSRYLNKNDRIDTIKKLKEIGYEVGSGMIVGLPYQTYDSLVEDLYLLKDLKLDMVAIGPYIPHKETPFYNLLDKIQIKDAQKVTLILIAILRILMKDINIPSTTALSVLNPKEGRILGLKYGANVIMPDLTPQPYRSFYDIYEGKTSQKEWNEEEQSKLISQLKEIGRFPSETKGFRSSNHKFLND